MKGSDYRIRCNLLYLTRSRPTPEDLSPPKKYEHSLIHLSIALFSLWSIPFFFSRPSSGKYREFGNNPSCSLNGLVGRDAACDKCMYF